MKFYDRKEELAYLEKQEKKSQRAAQMTLVIGRRRIGKTSLLKKSIEGKKALYFFIAKKSETLLVQEFSDLIKSSLSIQWYGQLQSFKEIFSLLMDHACKEPFTLILDEFQEFFYINPSIFSEMQDVWDSKKSESKINLIICGSIYSIMKRIFEDQREPLFGRITGKIHLQAFSTDTIKEIMADYVPTFSPQDLLAFYTITGGVAKYIETFILAHAFNVDDMLEELFQSNSTLLEEGKFVLIEEFGREYQTYFSILSLIASSKTSRPEIESILNMSIGAYLERLEKEFGIIKRIIPFQAKQGSRQIKYRIEDNFLNFWFRYIYKHRSMVELENFELLKTLVKKDFSTFAGHSLEKYFFLQFKESKRYSALGNYWEKGNQNELDLVAINEINRKLVIAEVKLNPDKYNENKLVEKSVNLRNSFPGYEISYQCLSLADM